MRRLSARLRRRLARLLVALLLGALALAGLDLGGRTEGSVEGRPAVIDGDTLAFGDRRIRIEGIDACERGQTATDAAGRAYDCGEAAREALAALVAGRTVSCRWSRSDRWGRRLARCRAGGEDLGGAMVRQGQARAYWRGGEPVEPAYLALEAAARLAGRGLWAGAADDPKDWRRERAEAPFWDGWF